MLPLPTVDAIISTVAYKLPVREILPPWITLSWSKAPVLIAVILSPSTSEASANVILPVDVSAFTYCFFAVRSPCTAISPLPLFRVILFSVALISPSAATVILPLSVVTATFCSASISEVNVMLPVPEVTLTSLPASAAPFNVILPFGVFATTSLPALNDDSTVIFPFSTVWLS